MMFKRLSVVALVIGALTGCGGGIGEAPDVRGFNLQDANRRLELEGYTSTIVEDDALFGVVVESNFTVCDQDSPKGKTVPLHVAKRGC